jgi:S-adenosylmethionine:tRNA ribosyltransferase-isomerase
MASSLTTLEFSLPPELEASEPPEARGLRRDEVRMMVSKYAANQIQHARFHDLPEFLEKDDLIVLNTSRTRSAALLAIHVDSTVLELHLSTHLDEDLWTVEVRSVDQAGKTKHFEDAHEGDVLNLPDGARAILQGPYTSDCESDSLPSETLWVANVSLPSSVDEYLARHGFPIKYNYVKNTWPLEYYQTVYATESGSAEMPSAGRPFTAELLERLRSKGIQIAPLILHTGISNLDSHEPPYREFYRVTEDTARLINETRAAGRRILAVGTTVVRALETVTDAKGRVHAGEGWTCLVVKPPRRLRAVNALLTGMHEPKASHLAMLEALAGLPHIKLAYEEALSQRYLWHEFGDLHLIIS